MASDVEVLRWLAKISAVVADVAGRPNDEVDRALSSALATLEALEAQPKVGGATLEKALGQIWAAAAVPANLLEIQGRIHEIRALAERADPNLAPPPEDAP